jgi:hypothetical protein
MVLAVEDVIAERAFYVEGETQPALIFRLSRPYQTEGDYPYCRCEFITGTTSSIVVPPEISSAVAKEKKVPGIDGADCILTSLRFAGSTVAGLNESVFGGKLGWAASPEGGRGLGLPTIEGG